MNTVSAVTLASKKNFESFFLGSKNKYTDFVVVVNCRGKRREYNLHKVILANYSDFFQAAFDSNLVEAQNNRMDLHFDDSREVLPLIFEFMYYSKINIDPNNIVAVLNAALFLQCTEIIDLARSELAALLSSLKSQTQISETSEEQNHKHFTILQIAIHLWKDAVAFNLLDVVDEIQQVLAPNFDLFSEKEDLSFLPYESFYSFITNASLVVENEFKYFCIINNYVGFFFKTGREPSSMSISDSLCKIPSSFRLQLTEEQIIQLYKSIAFEKMSLDQIEQAAQCPFIPKEVLITGLLNSLKSSKGIPIQSIERPSRVRKCRKSQSFVFTSDFDQNGILFYLGTQGLKKSFQNPHDHGIVKVEMSSVLIGSPANLVSREKRPTCTRSQSNEWILFDFGANLTISPSAYTLMHGSSENKCNLKYWEFEGSNDKTEWTTISSHKRDENLKAPFLSHTWQVTSHDHFRYLRIRTSGYFIQICGIEVYGELRSDYIL